jgi:hypothetical protein
MRLNLPILDLVASCRNLLIAGMGGGFDIFCGLPLYLELRERGQRVHLANLSFSPFLQRAQGSTRLSPSLVGVTAAHKGVTIYFPELDLARWFAERRGEEVTVWGFANRGGHQMLQDYRTLVRHLELDGILLVDGGFDALIRGDEEAIGTAMEDAVTLSAVSALEVPLRMMTCVGFGAERDMAYAQVLENVAELTAAGAFHGVCSLAPSMPVYQAYEDAVLWVNALPHQDPSVINASIVSAVQGNFGDYHLTQKTHGSRLWISPLMPLYWFFDLPAVAERNLFLEQVRHSESSRDALYVMSQIRRLKRRKPSRIELT